MRPTAASTSTADICAPFQMDISCLVDGELGARFVNAVRRRLEDVAAWRAAATAD